MKIYELPEGLASRKDMARATRANEILTGASGHELLAVHRMLTNL